MSCGSGPLEIKDGIVTTVAKAQCVSIPKEVVGFNKGSTTGWVFIKACSTIDEIDFSGAVNLKEIGDYTFYNCTKVKKFDLSACTSLSSVGICSFRECRGAINIIFPNSPLTVLPGGCFSFCENLESFEVPSNIQTIKRDSPDNYGVFYYCTKIQRISFQENSQCTIIENKAFFESSLEYLLLPKSLQKIEGWSFRSVRKLRSIEVEEGSKYFKSINGVLYKIINFEENKIGLCYYPQLASSEKTAKLDPNTEAIFDSAFIGIGSYTSVELPNTIKRIENTAFYNFNSLQTITIPSSVTFLGTELFGQCAGLTSVVFQNNFTVLTKGIFRGCNKLINFTIPSTVEKLDDFAFADCKHLSEVFVPKSVKTFGNGVFSNCPSTLKLVFEEGTDMFFENNYIYNTEKTDLLLYIGSETSIVIKKEVINILGGAFQGKDITEVTYEDIDKIQSIGSLAFDKCKNLKSIDLPNIRSITNGLLSFSSITSISIPQSVEEIEKDAFKGCSSLTSVTFQSSSTEIVNTQPSGLVTIGESAFESCNILESCTLPDTVKEIKKNAFLSCSNLITFKLPSSLQKIGESSFENSGIQSFTYDPSINLLILDHLSFCECNNLQTFVIPDSVSILKDNCISNCDSLTRITFGSGLSSIENFAIDNCPRLETIVIGPNDNLHEISSLAFQNCKVLATIEINNNQHFSFVDGMLLDYNQTNLMIFLKASNQKVIVLPATVKNIYMNAFSGCESIENVTLIGDTLNEIGYHSFSDCSSLKYISFPSSLTKIGEGAFKNCNLVSASLVNTKVVSLENEVFANNNNLNLIVIPNSLERCTDNTFMNTGKNPIVFYYGRNIIKNEVGLSKNSQVYCLNGYLHDIYLGLPVKTNYVFACTLGNKNSNVISCFRALSFILFTID